MKLALHDDLLSDTSEMKMVKVITVDMNCAYQARRGEKSQKKKTKKPDGRTVKTPIKRLSREK